ncbi:MAG: Chromate transporter [Proteobacteria bacterium]|nr:Chromate transporter [Pseudomonadota bacterium]
MEDSDHPQPQSLTDLFVSFTLLALQGFGGVLAVVQHELVERKRWLTREEFVEEWGMGAVAAGLIIATGIKLASALKSNPLGIPACIALSAACFVAIALLRWPLAYVVLGLGGAGCVLAYRRLKP